MTSKVDTRPDTSSTGPIEAARALAPAVRAAADTIEAERRLPGDLVEQLRAAGLFHLLIPRDYDGLEADPVTAARVVEEVSAADGSAGWCIMIAAQDGALTGMLPPEEARTVIGNRQIVAGTARPIGRAVASEDGSTFTVSGRWPFASGSSHADWMAGECKVYEPNGELRRDAEGNEVTRMLFVPASEAVIHDTWHTTGLRGTASHDFSIEGAIVPATRGFQVLVDEPKHPWAVYRQVALVFVTHGAQALGVARAALEAAREIASTKPGWGSDRPVAENSRVQAIIAEAVVTFESARHYMYATTEAAWQATLADDPDVSRATARMRLATSHAVTASVRAVDLVHDLLATSAIFAKSPLERPFRDIHTASAHVMIGPLTYEAAGRVELGLEPGMPFF